MINLSRCLSNLYFALVSGLVLYLQTKTMHKLRFGCGFGLSLGFVVIGLVLV